jgi:small-conductance mechanosensitive channel
VTVGSLLRYALIAVAFLVALAAVGINAGNLAILGGALGVGIGFGLQNIVNNFISGLLLAFERPVGIGDTVQVGPNTGEVREIGIRAKHHPHRRGRRGDRAQLRTDHPGRDQLDPLRYAPAHRHPDRRGLRQRPPRRSSTCSPTSRCSTPTCAATRSRSHLFLGFGDNSLDFSVRAWTDSPDWPGGPERHRGRHQRRAAEAGIEIPFPQRDLHLRSVDVELLKDLRGEATGA